MIEKNYINQSDSFDWISVAKGVGILLVVVGHFYPIDHPAYWTTVRSVIYAFHMPLFFVISGYLHNPEKYNYLDLLKQKVQRLLFPLFSVALLFFFAKLFLQNFVVLDHPVNAISVCMLLLDPIRSYVPLVWFVHALFIIFVLYPLLFRFVGNWSLLALAVVVHLVAGRHIWILGGALAYLPYFIVGNLIRENKERLLYVSDRYPVVGVALVAGFVFSYMLTTYLESVESPLASIPALVSAVSGVFFVLALSRFIVAFAPEKAKTMFMFAGMCSMGIYLLHPVFESAVRIFLMQLHYAHLPFVLVASLAITLGVIGPAILERRVLRRVKISRIYLLGMAIARNP